MATTTSSRPAPQSDPASLSNGPARGTGSIVRREALVLVASLVLGFIVVPLLIWVVGSRILGTYAHAQDPTAGTGPARLIADYFDGLAHGSLAFWCVALGPYALICLARMIFGFIRSAPGA